VNIVGDTAIFSGVMSNVHRAPVALEMSFCADATDKEKLVGLLGELAIKEGFFLSNLEGVKFLRSNEPFSRMPVVYEPYIVIVGKGKRSVTWVARSMSATRSITWCSRCRYRSSARIKPTGRAGQLYLSL
jgi:hypothetical protein